MYHSTEISKERYHDRRRSIYMTENWDELDQEVKALIHFMFKKNACVEARNWIIENSHLSTFTLWIKCERGDWLAWLIDTVLDNKDLEILYHVSHTSIEVRKNARLWIADQLTNYYDFDNIIDELVDYYEDDKEYEESMD